MNDMHFLVTSPENNNFYTDNAAEAYDNYLMREEQGEHVECLYGHHTGDYIEIKITKGAKT